MAIAKPPRRTTTTAGDDHERERRAEAFIAGGGTPPVIATTSTTNRKRTPITMKWDPALLERIDQAAKRKGVNRTAWVHYVISAALDRGEA